MKHASLVIVVGLTLSACAVEPPLPVTSHAVTAPNYPADSVKLGEQGTTAVKYLVREDGTVGDVRILYSSGSPRLDDAAVALVRDWKFKPATSNGKPVEMWLNTNIAWVLK